MSVSENPCYISQSSTSSRPQNVKSCSSWSWRCFLSFLLRFGRSDVAGLRQFTSREISSMWCLILFYTFFFHFRSLYDSRRLCLRRLNNEDIVEYEMGRMWKKRSYCYLRKYNRTEQKITCTFRENFRDNTQIWNGVHQEIRNHSTI